MLRWPVLALVLALAAMPAGAARAAGDQTVFVMDGHGQVRALTDPFLSDGGDIGPASTDAGESVVGLSGLGSSSLARGGSPPRSAPRRAVARPSARPSASVPSELRRLRGAGALDEARFAEYEKYWRDARRSLKKLKGSRKRDLAGVLSTASEMAADGLITSARIHDLVLTIRRNADWWQNGPLLTYGKRVRFTGSRLTWQYFPGQGIQIHWLGTFARMNNLFLAGGHDPELRETALEVRQHAVPRAGGIAWEYLFRFGGGRPPWVSGLAQGTGVQALSRAAVRLRQPEFFDVARSALGIFRTGPPSGVRMRTSAGAHYLAYSYAPGQRIYNAFLQSIIGLHDFSTFANDALGRELWHDGERQARIEIARADTGSWSQYQPGLASDLGYHKVLRDFARGLCNRLNTDRQREAIELRVVFGPAAVLEDLKQWPDPAPYCVATQNFNRYLYARLGLSAPVL